MLTLNPEQEKSVRHTQGNSLVIAGAGSGKTRTLIAKIIYLIQNQGVPPHHILAITFTNKAAREMRDRVAQISGLTPVGPGSQGLQIRTFHSFGVMFLHRFLHGFSQQENTTPTNYGKNFTIIDPDDQKRILRQLYPDYSPSDFPFKKYLYLISAWKNDFLYPQDPDFESKALEYYEDYGLVEDPRTLYHRYMAFLQNQNLLDFDDLIGLTVKLLREYPPAADYAGERWQQVLVDEYQDTNLAQEKIIEFFIEKGRSVTVVGDDQQSIYGFRGAKMENILSFKKKYPRVEVFILEENYRSTQPILNLANHVISKNPSIFAKKLFTRNSMGDLPTYFRFPNDMEETKWVVESIFRLQEEIPLDEIAIFYRTNYQSRILEDLLVRSRFPYQVVKGQKFYDRKEIKDVLAYLRWFINPHDRISFERLVNTPSRRLGEKTMAKIFAYLEENQIPLGKIFDCEELTLLLSNETRGSWAELKELFNELRERIAAETSPSSLVNYLIRKSGLQKLYEDEKDKIVRDQRLGNLDAFFEALDNFVQETGGSLEDFILSLSLGEEDKESEGKKIKLMTVHNAKGLEFQAVFVVGMEDGVFPHSLTLDHREEIEEERRLFYVAITRARKHLFLSSAALKYRFGSQTDFRESRFVEEIEDTFLVKETQFMTDRSPNQGGREEHEYYG